MTIIIVCITVIAVSLIFASVCIRNIEKEKYERSCPILMERTKVDADIKNAVRQLNSIADRLDKIIREAENGEE